MTNPSLVGRTSSFRSLLLGALLVAASASAAASASLTIGGSVASTANVTSAATGDAVALPLGGAGTPIGEQIIKVSDVAMITNNSSGLKLTIGSGNLTSVLATSTVAFKVQTVADGAVAPVSAAFTFGSGVPNDGYVSIASGADARDLYIAYTPDAVLDPGAYTGTISLEVADNN